MIELIKPLGHITTIAKLNEDQDLNALKLKSITFTHEFMFARPIHRTPDMIKQHEYLEEYYEKYRIRALPTNNDTSF